MMLKLPPNLLSSFLVIDVRDPDELGPDSAVTRRFPRGNNAHRYHLRRAPPPAKPAEAGTPPLLTRLAMARLGDLQASYVFESRASDIEIVEPGLDRFCVSAMVGGSLALSTPDGQQTLSAAHRGLVLRGRPGTRFRSSDDSTRFNLWVDARRVESTLTAVLGRPLQRPLAFDPGVDVSVGAGASLLRLLQFVAHDLARPDGIASSAPALGAFTELWVQTMLQGLAHNHRGAMAERHHGAAVPRHVKRAEEFMRENAARPLRLAAVAEAAGCSLRTLHSAFGRFRETTPLAALQAIRLDLVRARLDAGGGALHPAQVAREYGFTNPSRFRAAYLRRFGVPPPGAGRR